MLPEKSHGVEALAGHRATVGEAHPRRGANVANLGIAGRRARKGILITTSDDLASAVLTEIDRQLESLSTADVASVAWRDYGEVRVVGSLDEAVFEANALAYEHVEILTEEPRYFLEHLHNYGSLFLGEETTVAYGDKTIGTNHILPTAGAARYTGGLWVGKFLKTVTYQEASPEASVLIGEVCARQCRIENFEAHARSCDVRVEKFSSRVPA